MAEGFGAGSALTGAGGGVFTTAARGGAAAAACTVRLFTTVRTPLICATSLAATERAVSFVTVPFSVTTPELTVASSGCPDRFGSDESRFVTWDVSVASSGVDDAVLQPETVRANARETVTAAER